MGRVHIKFDTSLHLSSWSFRCEEGRMGRLRSGVTRKYLRESSKV